MRSNSLGEIIRSLRKQAGLSQEELADGICSPVSISRIENGTQMPSGNVLDKTMEAIRMGEELLAALKKHKSVLREYLVIKINLAFNLAQFMEKEKRYKEALITIRNNVTLYGAFSENEIRAAIQSAGLEEVIRKLPDGIETQVEENGARFSGGEKQRIAIARAILHKKTVFLVDEATSALDNKNAKIVEESILAMEDVTCITVTHHLNPESEKRYDEVLKMEDGTLVKKE